MLSSPFFPLYVLTTNILMTPIFQQNGCTYLYTLIINFPLFSKVHMSVQKRWWRTEGEIAKVLKNNPIFFWRLQQNYNNVWDDMSKGKHIQWNIIQIESYVPIKLQHNSRYSRLVSCLKIDSFVMGIFLSWCNTSNFLSQRIFLFQTLRKRFSQ